MQQNNILGRIPQNNQDSQVPYTWKRDKSSGEDGSGLFVFFFHFSSCYNVSLK